LSQLGVIRWFSGKVGREGKRGCGLNSLLIFRSYKIDLVPLKEKVKKFVGSTLTYNNFLCIILELFFIGIKKNSYSSLLKTRTYQHLINLLWKKKQHVMNYGNNLKCLSLLTSSTSYNIENDSREKKIKSWSFKNLTHMYITGRSPPPPPPPPPTTPPPPTQPPPPRTRSPQQSAAPEHRVP